MSFSHFHSHLLTTAYDAARPSSPSAQTVDCWVFVWIKRHFGRRWVQDKAERFDVQHRSNPAEPALQMDLVPASRVASKDSCGMLTPHSSTKQKSVVFDSRSPKPIRAAFSSKSLSGGREGTLTASVFASSRVLSPLFEMVVAEVCGS